MGLLTDFYAGEPRRIVAAWRRNDGDVLSVPGIVAAHADLSFNVGTEELDRLVLAACELSGRPPFGFAECVLEPAPLDAESGIHELADVFRDLLADLPAGQANALYDRWMERLPAPPAPAAELRWRRWAESLRGWISRVVIAAILLPVLAAMWLLSRSFREQRRANVAAREARAKAVESEAYTLRDGVAKLLETCRTAKERKQKVLYAWSL